MLIFYHPVIPLWRVCQGKLTQDAQGAPYPKMFIENECPLQSFHRWLKGAIKKRLETIEWHKTISKKSV